MRLYYALAAVAILVRSLPTVAQEPSASSAPTCDYGEHHRNPFGLTPELWAKSAATFKKLCEASSIELVNAQDPRLKSRLSHFGLNFVSGFANLNEALRHGRTGLVLVILIVEPDGHVSSVGLLNSTGNEDLDKAWLNFGMQIVFKPTIRLDSKPVRGYFVYSAELSNPLY